MAQKAFGGHGLSDSHAISNYNLGQVTRRAQRGLRQAGRGNNRNRKADFENQAKLMQYGANLADWHNSQAPGHAAAMMRAQREAGTYYDDEGNVLGNISGSWKGAEGTSGNIGGWKNAKRAQAEETEDNPHGQGQQMKQFAGPRNVFLGSEIPTLTSENSATDSNGRISSIGWTRYDARKRTFESNTGNRDAYQNQQDVQNQQADSFHNRGQQMSLF